MVSSTAIPTVMAATVIVIISSGMPSQPIRPSTEPAAIRFGAMPISASFIDRNRIRNITMMARNTMPMVLIWESNRLCSMLLYITVMPVSFT